MLLKKQEAIDELEKKTKQLARRAKKGDQDARKELIELHLPLAKHTANRYSNGDDYDEVLQNACIGLCRAVDKYNPRRKNQFATFAGWWIRNQILKGKRAGHAISVPQDNRTIANATRRFMDEFQQKFNREPTNEEIAQATGQTMDEVLATLSVMVTTSPFGRVPLDGPGKYKHEYLLADTETLERRVDRAIALKVLWGFRILLILDDLERAVVIERFKLPGYRGLTEEQLGKEYGCTHDNVNLKLKKALYKLREFIKRNNWRKEQQRG
ncbi:MAG: sigma-70 family RNA polymerase sigma factor [Patescibacteria group bacterium]|nr:sigma-70 family RNA polymerase sigma factor [Patescibacteria group bacterium]